MGQIRGEGSIRSMRGGMGPAAPTGCGARALVLVATALLVAACGPSQEELERQARVSQFEARVRKHYGQAITAGTFGEWKVTSVGLGPPNRFSESISKVVVVLAPPQNMADDIVSRASDAQFRPVGLNACPPRNHSIWTGTTGNDFLELQVLSVGKVFIDVDCRRYGP